MRTGTRAVVVVLSAMLLAVSVMAAEPQDNREPDHVALRALMAKAVAAINRQDAQAFSACFIKDFAFTTVDDTVLTNTLAAKKYFDKLLHQKDSLITGFTMTPKPSIPAIFIDANTGYCYGTSDDAYTLKDSKRVIHIMSRWTATVVKKDGEWKIAAAQAGVNVADNPVIDIRSMSVARKLQLALGMGKYPGER